MRRKKIGLALGSGGTRGFAHIGVLKVLIEEEIPIDYVVGCSAGAVVGAYYSVHGEIESFERMMMEMSRVEFAKFVDIATPRRAIIRGKRMLSYLNQIYEGKSFSETTTPLKVVTTDLRKGKEVDIKRGNISEAVMASSSLPGIFPPVKLGKQLLVDGGVVNPTPVDVVRRMGADIILGVDLTMKGNTSMLDPNIFEVIVRSFDILRTETTKMTAKKVAKDLLIIKPKINTDYGFVGYFRNREEVIQEGERVARKALPKIKKLLSRGR